MALDHWTFYPTEFNGISSLVIYLFLFTVNPFVFRIFTVVLYAENTPSSGEVRLTAITKFFCRLGFMFMCFKREEKLCKHRSTCHRNHRSVLAAVFSGRNSLPNVKLSPTFSLAALRCGSLSLERPPQLSIDIAWQLVAGRTSLLLGAFTALAYDSSLLI